jgi:hypothetical protein
MSDNGSGKLRVTLPVNKLYYRWYDRIAVDGSHYIFNYTRTAVSAITAKGGTSAGGYWFDTSLNYAGSTWVNTDRCIPQRQAAINSYTAEVTCFNAMAAGDYMLKCRSTTAESPTWPVSLGNVTKCVSIIGTEPNQQIRQSSSDIYYYMQGDLSANTIQTEIENLFISQHYSAIDDGFRIVPTAGKASAGTIFRDILFYGCEFGLYIGSNQTANTIEMHNCMGILTQYPFYPAVPAKFYNCTSWCGSTAFANGSLANTWTNCLSLWDGTGFSSKTNGIYATCASTDATGSAGLINLTQAQVALWHHNDNGCFWPNPRILTSSVLYHAGTYIATVLKDIDGNTRANPPSIGAHEGTTTPYGVTHPSAVGKVLSDETWQEWTGAKAGTYHEATVAEVQKDVTFGAASALTGLYVTAIPAKPTVVIKSVASGTVTLTITGVVGTAYAYYRKGTSGTWSAKSESWKRASDGDLAITGLDDPWAYEYMAQNEDGVPSRLSQSDILPIHPTAPTLVSAIPGSSKVTLHVHGVIGKCYIQWRIAAGDFGALSETYTLTADGDIEVPLTTYVKHFFRAVNFYAGAYSASSQELTATPTDPAHTEYVLDAAEAAKWAARFARSEHRCIFHSRGESSAVYDVDTSPAVTETYEDTATLTCAAPRGLTSDVVAASAGKYATTDFAIFLLASDLATEGVTPKPGDKVTYLNTGDVFRVLTANLRYARCAWQIVLRKVD